MTRMSRSPAQERDGAKAPRTCGTQGARGSESGPSGGRLAPMAGIVAILSENVASFRLQPFGDLRYRLGYTR